MMCEHIYPILFIAVFHPINKLNVTQTNIALEILLVFRFTKFPRMLIVTSSAPISYFSTRIP